MSAPSGKMSTGACAARIGQRIWSSVLVCGLLAASTHAGLARTTAHTRHTHHVIPHKPHHHVIPHRSHHHVILRKPLHHGTPAPRRVRPQPLAHTARPFHHHAVMAAAKPLIVIDPGHGGKDPGAIGASGTLEKNVTLATALDLKRLLLATGRYRVALTRSSDRFVPLADRLAFAQAHTASLLISLHADASADRHARGASVYIRANHPAAVPLVTSGSISADATKALASVIPPASAASPWLQYTMIDNLDDDIPMTADPARKAHFYVLANSDIPSVLLEMGFLSNRHDETLLRKPRHQKLVAAAIRDAVSDYFNGVQKLADSRT